MLVKIISEVYANHESLWYLASTFLPARQVTPDCVDVAPDSTDSPIFLEKFGLTQAFKNKGATAEINWRSLFSGH